MSTVDLSDVDVEMIIRALDGMYTPRRRDITGLEQRRYNELVCKMHCLRRGEGEER